MESQSLPATEPAPQFGPQFREQLEALFRWRRDVRRFRDEPLAPELVDDLLHLAALAPSVGNSQPWRFVKVSSARCRSAVRANFQACNRRALEAYDGDRAGLYARLKLAGFDRAPVQLAVFADTATPCGAGLGQATMPETLRYSVVGAVHGLWLAARARGIGVGWVSILDPVQVAADLAVPPAWSLVAYLCIGWPEEDHLDPELVRADWQQRLDVAALVVER